MKEVIVKTSTVVIEVNGHKVNATFCGCPVNNKSLCEIKKHCENIEAGVK